ncbi:MAG: HNH endonuclease [Candidatus Cloacimonetes bacterium]|nr:HNH endonuclease [Candidatus Cloacimonadota bacterium]
MRLYFDYAGHRSTAPSNYYGMRNNRCDSRYRVEIHHIEPKSRGGKDTIDNLVTRCHDHHRLIHETFFEEGRSWIAIR